jgi:glycosyltransferase involved in cell wall biosynthesis
VLTRPRFLAFALRRLPAILRHGRWPRRPADLVHEVRVSFRAFARPPRPWHVEGAAPRPARPGAVRVVLVTHNLNPFEGAPLSLFALARGLSEVGYDLLIVAREDGAQRAAYEAEGMPVEIADPVLGIDAADAYPEYQRRVHRLAGWVKASGARAVFGNTLRSFWAVSLARAADLPSVWCVRESVDWRTYFRDLPPPVAREAVESLRAADRLVFVADATRRLFAPFEDPRRVHTIHNGVDVATIDVFKRAWSKSRVRAAHGVDDAARVVTVVGTTCERKGQLDLLRAAATLGRHGSRRLRIHVVGARPGPYLEALKAFARRERLGGVMFVEETPRVLEYYRMTDVFVCTSHEESFPRIILEAMACELPIVSTNVHGIPEALTHDVNALLVEPGDVPALAAGVARLLDDSALAQRLGRNAYTTLTSRFTVEQMIKEYDRLLAGCLIR